MAAYAAYDWLVRHYFQAGMAISLLWLLGILVATFPRGVVVDGCLRVGQLLAGLKGGFLIWLAIVVIGFAILGIRYGLDSGCPTCAKQEPQYCSGKMPARYQEGCVDTCEYIRVERQNGEVDVMASLANAWGSQVVGFNLFALACGLLIGIVVTAVALAFQILRLLVWIWRHTFGRLPVRW